MNTEADWLFFHRPASRVKFVATLESGLHSTGASLVMKMSEDEDSTISVEIDGIKTISLTFAFRAHDSFISFSCETK